LGFTVSPKGLTMEKEKVAAIATWPEPTLLQDIQVFLGFTGFYRRFIKNYAKVTISLTDKLKGKSQANFQLSTVELVAFKKLIWLFIHKPLLRHFDPKLFIKMETNAFIYAIKAVSTQLHKGC
jgi:hypothetical protein